ncbi:MAG: diguanylate cyclase [Proteobacteria bacterium]|nr:diguanylate cyclase [Pseudomonadota bacterium]
MTLKKSEFTEAILGLSLLAAINFLWFRHNLGFSGVNPHPYWIVIVPIAARYGFKGGLWAGFLSGLTMIAMMKLNLPDISMSEFMEIRYFSQPILFITAGIIIGEIREVQKKRFQDLKTEFNDISAAFENLSERYATLENAKQEIDTRIISQEHTLSTLYEAAQALKSLKEEEIYPAVLNLLKDFIAVGACSIYKLSDNKLQLVTSLGDIKGTRQQEAPSDKGIMGRAILSGETVSINTLMSSKEFSDQKVSDIIISAPLVNSENEIMGVLNVEEIPFVKFNPQTIRMTSLMADWCSAGIVNARTYKDTKDKNISDEVTGFYTYRYFQERFREEFQRARRYELYLSMLAIEIVDLDSFIEKAKQDIIPILSRILKDNLRNIDLICQDSSDPSKYFLILPSTPMPGARVVEDKIIRELKAFKFKPYEDKEKLLKIRTGIAEIDKEMKSPDELIEKAYKDIHET